MENSHIFSCRLGHTPALLALKAETASERTAACDEHVPNPTTNILDQNQTKTKLQAVMKPFISYSFLAAVAASGLAFGQTPVTAKTTPVGYVTESFKAGVFNLFGLTLQNSPVISGTFESAAGLVLTDTGANFPSVLTADTQYILEIGSGPLQGAIQEIASSSGDGITLIQDISAQVPAGTTYSIRAAATIAEVFGATNSAGLLPGAASTADVLWVPNGAGGFDQFYYAAAQPPFLTAGWRQIGQGNTDKASVPLVYLDGMILQRRGSTDLSLVVSGEVKKTATSVAISGTAGSGFNYLASIFPVGSTLGNSGLEASVTKGNSTSADIIWIPNGTGGYNQYYYATAQPPFFTAGWKQVGGGNTDQAAAVISSGLILQRRGADAMVLITPPGSYSDL